MNYQLINIRIETAKGNRISGSDTGNKYLAAGAMNPYDEFEPVHNVVSFDQNTVKKWEKRLPKHLGGLLDMKEEEWDEEDPTKLDPKLRILKGGVDVEFDLGGIYCRTYTSDIVDSDGNVIPGKHKGDVITNAAGTAPKSFSTIMVFCRKSYKMEPVFDEETWEPKLTKEGKPMMKPARDKDGQLIEEWVKGWSPNEVGENMRNLLIPLEDALKKFNKQHAEDEDDDAENSKIFDEEEGEEQSQKEGLRVMTLGPLS